MRFIPLKTRFHKLARAWSSPSTSVSSFLSVFEGLRTFGLRDFEFFLTRGYSFDSSIILRRALEH